MDKGDLVPDDLVIEMTRARMLEASEEGGYVLDGYPRTLAQAEAAYRWALSRGIPFDLTLNFEIEEEELFARLAGRAREQHRSDDTEETIRHRLEVFAIRPAAGRLLPAAWGPGPDQRRRRSTPSARDLRHLHWHKARTMAAGSPAQWARAPPRSS